jgi:Bacterial Ig-like domain
MKIFTKYAFLLSFLLVIQGKMLSQVNLGMNIYTLAPTPITSPYFSVIVSFAEPVTYLDNSDFFAVNATIASISTDDNIIYTVIVSNQVAGTSSFTINANSVQNAIGQSNLNYGYFQWDYQPAPPSGVVGAVITPVTPIPVNPSTISATITFTEAVSNFDISDVLITGATLNGSTTTDNISWVLDLIPNGSGSILLNLPAGVTNGTVSGYPNGPASRTIEYSPVTPLDPIDPSGCLVEYYLEEQNDGYYQISLISNTNWAGTDAITATGQVTIKVGTGVYEFGPNDDFTVTDLTMLIPGVTWSQNSRYYAPEQRGFDYISFGMTTYGTNLIPYVAGDTVPLFRFKNLGICSGDSVYLMPITGDAFAWPNSLNANVGQQLSVSGYNEPDVPLCVSGVASCMSEVTFDMKALLQGAYVSADGLMHDQLRTQGLIPTTEPYGVYLPIRASTYAPFTHKDDGGGESFATTGAAFNADLARDNIVDWVMIELRDATDSSVVSTRSALVQRDGDIRDTLGNDFVVFRKLREDSYFITVRHRNHLGLMTVLPKHLSVGVNRLDFTDLGEPMIGEDYYLIQHRPGDPLVFTRHPGITIDGKRMLWAGNSNADNYIMFQGGGIGEGLDIDNVFDNIFSDPLNANYSYNHVRDGYYPGDNNLDGKVKYQGPANDVDPFIFFNIISRHPDNISKFINFYITEGIPRD